MEKKGGLKLLKMKNLRAALRGRPDVLRLVLSLYRILEKKRDLVIKLKAKVEKMKRESNKVMQDSSCQTDCGTFIADNVSSVATDAAVGTVATETPTCAVWGEGDGQQKSIAEQVAEAAQSALAQTGMVYVESAGMYYDYKSGYYYNSELGLYYHSSTGCYYYYSEDKKEFTYHSHADTSAHTQTAAQTAASHVTTVTPAALPPQTQELLKKKEKLRKHKKDNHHDKDGPTEAKRKKKEKKMKCDLNGKLEEIANDDKTIKDKNGTTELRNNDSNAEARSSNKNAKSDDIIGKDSNNDVATKQIEEVVIKVVQNKEEKEASENDAVPHDEIEDGECSDTASEAEDESEAGADSDSTVTDVDESVAKHHPPCMRIVVRETSLPKLKVGTLFLVTKDGGTLGREGEQHTVLLRDENVSRIHLQFIYNDKKRCYEAIDLGSKNGTILNGTRMSEAQQVSQPMEVVHGSMVQVGESKLLCHVHAGSDTCGHCEPGLIMAAADAEKRVAYTRTGTIQKQHALELARLKNRYAPEPLAIEDSSYNDRAKARRDQVGSSHHAEKTLQNDLDTSIAEDNKGFQMLSKMGWKEGDGLGREQQGETQPVPLVSNAGKAGLGAGGVGVAAVVPAMTLARPRRPLKSAAKAFRDPLEDDD